MIEVPMIRTYTCIQFQYVNVSDDVIHLLRTMNICTNWGGLVSADNDADIPRSLLLEHMKSTIFALYCVHVHIMYTHTHTHK